MLPNSMEFVEKEMNAAMAHGITDLWVINTSNIKPHVYRFSFIANLWKKNALSVEEHRKRYVCEYYGEEGDSAQLLKMEACIRGYSKPMLPFGDREDEHAGEQFYNYVVRDLIHGRMKDRAVEPLGELFWYKKQDAFDNIHRECLGRKTPDDIFV